MLTYHYHTVVTTNKAIEHIITSTTPCLDFISFVFSVPGPYLRYHIKSQSYVLKTLLAVTISQTFLGFDDLDISEEYLGIL